MIVIPLISQDATVQEAQNSNRWTAVFPAPGRRSGMTVEKFLRRIHPLRISTDNYT